MKIALLLTGQLRSNDIVRHMHMNSLISKYDTDIFMSIDTNNVLQCINKNPHEGTSYTEVASAIEYYKPQKYYVDKTQIKDETLIFRQYRIVKHAYTLLLDHIKETKKHYDIIVRLRFDQLIYINTEPYMTTLNRSDRSICYNNKNCNLIKQISKDQIITFDRIDPNTLYVFGYGIFKGHNYNYVNDQFFYHDSSILNKMYNFYDNMRDLDLYCTTHNIGNHGARIECMFYLYLVKENIHFKRTNIHGEFLRILNNTTK